MKPFRTIFPILLALAALAGGCSSSSKPMTVTVMTYNIHHGADNEKKLDLPRIADVIRAEHPDLVALQELDKGTGRTNQIDEPAELGRLLAMQAIFGKAMNFDGGQYGDAVLSALPIEASRVHALPWTPGKEHEPRCAVEVTCRGTNGKSFLFLSTHLDHTHEPSDRLSQATALREALSSAKLPVILAGDFNCTPETPPLVELANDFEITTKDEPPTCPSDKPSGAIDHVLVKPAKHWRVIETRVIDDSIASDHRPVVVKLEYQP